ncbi:hypothetical protein OQA88_12005 [Cercophora sp. LCS_1]
MASPSIQNPPAATESKSARKKKAKAAGAERTESPAPAASTPSKAASAAGDAEDISDSPYIREFQKNIRNVNKKISNLVKIETIVNEHKGKDLDELVASKIINADQKASLLKKPALQAQLAQLEEQLAQQKKIELEHRVRVAEVEKTLTENFQKEKASAIAEVKDQAAAEAKATLHSNLLVLSQFLRLAAARRAEGEDTSDEGQALEGVLLHIYSGDEAAVTAMLKLVGGSDEQTTGTNGEQLQTTFARVKELSVSYLYGEAPVEAEAVEAKEGPQSDPTVANAGLTEIEEGSAEVLTNGHSAEPSTADSAPSNADVADSAANAAGESQWDTPNDLTMSQEWVEVKAPEAESTEDATPAAPANASWADDHPETHEAPADPNDGFHQVQRNRGNREGGYRGRGERGGYRGRGGGFRGDGRGRGRGRGGDRGGMASRPRGNRGAEATQESR